MTQRCARPVPFDRLVEYWSGELAAPDELAVDEHLMGCAACTAESARVSAVTEALRAEIPPLLTTDGLAKLRARGLVVTENPMTPGERREVVFPKTTDILLHRLGGLDLASATRVDFRIWVESTGAPILELPNAPFDRDGGAVLVACQQHFAAYPPDTVAEVTVTRATGTAPAARYTILHRFE
jgi:hypothetical protein